MAPLTSRSRVVRSDTASTVPVASPASMMSPTPYWSSTQDEHTGEEVLHEALRAEAEGHADDARPRHERAEVDADLAEDRDAGDGPHHEARPWT